MNVKKEAPATVGKDLLNKFSGDEYINLHLLIS